MPIRITCPSCAASLSVRDEFAGRAVKCPKCKGVIPPQDAPSTVSEPDALATLPPAPPPPAVAPKPQPMDLPPDEPEPAPARSAFEGLDEPSRPAKSGSKVVPRPDGRSRDDEDEERPQRKRREDDEEEDGRPRRRRRDEEEDDRPGYRPKRGKSNSGVVIALIGGLLLLLGGGGALAWYLTSKSDDTETAADANSKITRANFLDLKIGTATRAQVEQTIGTGRAATADDLSKVLGSDENALDKWMPLVTKNRAVLWQNGSDYVLAAFHPNAEADSRLQLKEWRSKNSTNTVLGEASDIAFLSRYPPADKADDLSGPAVAATGAEIAQAYTTDRAAADAKYKDKVVTVEGSLTDIELTADGTMYARIIGVGEPGAGGIAPRVAVQPGEMNKVLNCSWFQTVMFKGRCTGLSGTFVEVKSGKMEGKPGPDPAALVGGSELVASYAANEQKANERFKDQFITVTGAVVDSKTADAVYLVAQKSKDLKIKLILTPEFLRQFDGIPKGRAVKVKGVCLGKFGDEVHLTRGWLVPSI